MVRISMTMPVRPSRGNQNIPEYQLMVRPAVM